MNQNKDKAESTTAYKLIQIILMICTALLLILLAFKSIPDLVAYGITKLPPTLEILFLFLFTLGNYLNTSINDRLRKILVVVAVSIGILSITLRIISSGIRNDNIQDYLFVVTVIIITLGFKFNIYKNSHLMR